MIILGIESTAHTFGIGIIKSVGKKNSVLANVKDLYTTEKEGIIPAKVADHHVEVCDVVFEKALKEAKIKKENIDVIAFSQSPGLGHTLRIGAMFARSLAVSLNKPLVGVNHCIAHLEIGRLLTKAKDPILLYASGANTQVIAYEAGKYRIFGETLDIGVGNFLDTFARALGIGFPGGPKIEQLAKSGKKYKKYIELPYVVKGMDVSFGGILTNIQTKWNSQMFSKEDLCYSGQETVFSMLVEVTERALAHTGKKEVLLGGGVACNKRLQEMVKIMCKERGAKSFVPENQFLVDNGAMIAWLGKLQFDAGIVLEIEKAIIEPYLRTDEIMVKWR
ncbi:bifunctional N(6)-L-threonylcarbamoyladenine synthase/serine/threonine protein kinase [Candidatus Woesearchaeota archaeon]|nr:bifunctional N(6)-L-threonylcarbamoyladenine synthase/serine/threonine protein kinase [Candidatus Woesearchaeota archaeon]